jgi:DNA-binding NtrC family response regulator
MKPRVLVTWIGATDLLGMAERLPSTEGDRIFAALGRPRAGPHGEPTRTLLEHESFDEVHLLTNDSYPIDVAERYAGWLESEAQLHPVALARDEVTDYVRIFAVVDAFLAKLTGRMGPKPDLVIHLSPGTPAMTAIWVLLGRSKYPATFYQTYQGQAWKTEIPYDIIDDFVPALLRNPDLNLQHLASRHPGEIRGFERIAGESPAIRLAAGRASQAARRMVPVLIQGETGTGKELFARAMHEASPRDQGPFVAVNCAALPETLLESTLFGHVKGAFTGATHDHPGAFREADGGTLFLDEVGECSTEMQAKLLRVLQPPEGKPATHREFRPVGGSREVQADVRIISATNRDLLANVREDRFREDLYYRLAVLTIRIPPLRERKQDLPRLVEQFMADLNAQFAKDEPGYRPKALAGEAVRFLTTHSWPGNVRELYNVLIQAAVLTAGETIGRDALAAVIAERRDSGILDKDEEPLGAGFSLREHLAEIERQVILRALKEANGVKSRAAVELLGMKNYQALDSRLRVLKIKKEDWTG